MAMDVEPFYYLRVEDVVPRDAVYVVIGGSITVVPPLAFAFHKNLVRVEFQEGVEEIGWRAFRYCRNLTRVGGSSSLRAIDNNAFQGCDRLSEVVLWEGLQRIGKWAFKRCALERITVPSSVVEIGDYAFENCERLSEVDLQEGLRQIGQEAFERCGLRRITIPSSVVEIGDYAFSHCETLSEAILREGLRRIGESAFEACALRRITIPSSVKEIGESAFESCNDLEAVKLMGGTVLVGWGAFDNCPRLKRISISSIAIVVEKGEDCNGRTAVVTGGIERDPYESTQLILASPHLASMRPEDLADLKEAIDRIVDTTRGAGPLDLSVGDVSGPIRNCFIDRLSTWYSGYKNEVAATLELGLWKIELGRTRGAGQRRAAGRSKRTKVDVPTRDDSRRTCGADPIVGLVLSALAGPHRRTDQGENEGLIQP